MVKPATGEKSLLDNVLELLNVFLDAVVHGQDGGAEEESEEAADVSDEVVHVVDEDLALDQDAAGGKEKPVTQLYSRD